MGTAAGVVGAFAVAWLQEDSTPMGGSITAPRVKCLLPKPRPSVATAYQALAKRRRKGRASLRDLLALNVERHGRPNNDIRAVAGNIHMPWLREPM